MGQYLWRVQSIDCNIREHVSILYLEMAMEILNLKFTTDVYVY